MTSRQPKMTPFRAGIMARIEVAGEGGCTLAEAIAGRPNHLPTLRRFDWLETVIVRDRTGQPVDWRIGLSDTGRRVLAAWREAENLAGRLLAPPSASPNG